MAEIIHVYPHKSTQTTLAIYRNDLPLARPQLGLTCVSTRLLAWAESLRFDLTWAGESAEERGKLLAQQLV